MSLKTSVGLTFCFFLSWAIPGIVNADNLKIYGEELQKKFPDVVFISTEELAGAPAAASGILLIDAREPEEFEISRLPGAVLAGRPMTSWLDSLNLGKDQRIVVYCSVGYRSAILARELQNAGFTDVVNLTGSIFAWANEGRALENSAGPACGVHPFDVKWGRYLEKARWQWTP